MSSTYPAQLTRYRLQIIAHLQKYLQQKPGNLSLETQWLSDVCERLMLFVSTGKTIRGSLLLLTTHMYNREVTIETLSVASALELAHAAILIHDDIIDEDHLRHNNDTLHIQYEKWARKNSFAKSGHLGISLALSGADSIFFMAHELLAGITLKEPYKSQLLTLFAQEMQQVSFAQMQDIKNAHDSHEVPEEDILTIYRLKTGRYTFGLPLCLGALLTEQPEESLQLLMQLGEEMGVLFQLKDDDLSIFGTAATGKLTGSDIERNNKTLHRLWLFNRVKEHEQKKLHAIFGNGHLLPADFSFVQQLMIKLDVQIDVAKKMRKLSQNCELLIQSLPVDKIHQQVLLQLLSFITSRTS